MNRYQRFLYTVTKYFFGGTLVASLAVSLFVYPPIAALLGLADDTAAVTLLTVFLIGTTLGTLLISGTENTLSPSRLFSLLLLLGCVTSVLPLRALSDMTKEGYLFPLAVALSVPPLLIPKSEKKSFRFALRTVCLLLAVLGMTVSMTILFSDRLLQALVIRFAVLPLTAMASCSSVLLTQGWLRLFPRLLPLPLIVSLFYPVATRLFLPLFFAWLLAVCLNAISKTKRS